MRGIVALSALVLTACLVVSTSAASADEDGGMIYELRTYTCHPGKLADLHARFKNHTMKLFEKHGMKNIIYWTPTDKEDTLVYVVAHKSEAAAKASWKGFVNDPDWKKAYAESIANGKLVMKVDKQFLKPTEYSPNK